MNGSRAWALPLAGLLLLFVAGCASGPAAAAPRLRAVALEPGDGITINDATDDVTIDITSERGIGKMEIVRTGRPPKTLTVNFHLKGLEELRWTWGDATLLVHVSSSDGSVREEVSRSGGTPAPIDSASPDWAPVTIEAEDPSIPLANGFFSVSAPPAFLDAAPERFTLQWIDFYR